MLWTPSVPCALELPCWSKKVGLLCPSMVPSSLLCSVWSDVVYAWGWL